MSTVARPRRRQSLRLRITVSIVATVAVLTAALSIATYLGVRTLLESQRIRSDTRQTAFTAQFARDFLTSHPGDVRGMVGLLQNRENFDALAVTPAGSFSTGLGLRPSDGPPALIEQASSDPSAHQAVRLRGARYFVFAQRLSVSGVDLYLFYPLSDIDATLSLLRRVLILASVTATVVAAVLAQWVSRRILRPLDQVSRAARRIAEGLLETRVETSSADEVGVLAASFNEMAAALQGIIRRERNFVAASSHELRTPLAVLRTSAEVLASHREELPPTAREAADLVLHDVRGLQRLVEELLEVSELDSRRATVRLEDVDVRALARAVVARRHLEVPVTGTDARVLADKARMERIVGNLVDNAFEHGRGQGVQIDVRTCDGTAELRVRDRGPGVPEDERDRIFEPFSKGDAARTRGTGGVGLGLAIAARNARLLGGTLSLEDADVPGATFALRLPLVEDAEGGAREGEVADADAVTQP